MPPALYSENPCAQNLLHTKTYGVGDAFDFLGLDLALDLPAALALGLAGATVEDAELDFMVLWLIKLKWGDATTNLQRRHVDPTYVK